MLNDLLRSQLEKHDGSDVDVDSFDGGPPYRRWAPGVRTLLRLRYLAIKKRVLRQFRQDLDYDVTAAGIQAGVLEQVHLDSKPDSLWTFLLTPAVVLLSLLAIAATIGWGIYHSLASAREQLVFEQYMPDFSDSVYLLKAQKIRDVQAGAIAAEPTPDAPLPGSPAAQTSIGLTAQINSLRSRILAHFDGLPGIQAALGSLLDGVEQDDTGGQEMINRAKRFNDLLFNRKIPYYVSLVSETAYCADLPSERFFSRLFGGEQSSGDVCQVHALTAFDVEESRYYAERSDRHLALFTRRLDKQDLQDSFLGLVHIGDDRAQVRLSNIQNASADSLTAVSDGALRSKLMPDGMPDVYGLESLARRLQSRVVNAYVDDIERRWWLRIPSLWQELTGHKPDLLALAARRLQARIADVTAFHEVQHLVDQSVNIEEPAWFDEAIRPFGKRVQNETMRRHILWELSAFFTHLAYARELQGILLNDFTTITLNPMLQDQPHFYSIRILLPVLHRQLKGELSTEVQPARTLADVANAYKALAANSDDIGRLAREAYPLLFDKPLPQLHLTRVPPRSSSRNAGVSDSDL